METTRFYYPYQTIIPIFTNINSVSPMKINGHFILSTIN